MRYVNVGAAVVLATILNSCGAPSVQSEFVTTVDSGDPTKVERFLIAHPEVDVNWLPGGNGAPMLEHAAANGDVGVMRVLLKHGADPNALHSEMPPILGAIFYGHNEAAELLLNEGANANAREPTYGHTALMEAARLGRIDLVRLLLERGADPKAKSIDGRSALDMARGAHNVEIVGILQPSIDVLKTQ